MLETLGLGSSVEAVYRGLLQEPTAGIAELCLLLGFPEAEVRAGLDRLIDLELLQPSRDVPGALRAVSPDVGLEMILRRQEAEVLRRQEELARSKEAVARMVAGLAAARPEPEVDAFERLVGLDAIQDRLRELTRDLREECLSIMPGGAQSQGALDASRPLDEVLLARGVVMRTLYQDSARNDPATHAYARWMTDLGGEVRTSPIVPPRLLVVDRTTALVPVDPENSRAGALCTTSPGMVNSLVSLFERAWQAAVPLGADTRSRADDEELNATERELLKLLAGGLTDEAAGKRLGLSLRTVRRQMSGLMERLGASSRFEAGLEAGRRGWL
ncbi:LuxR C-terminal-related transcriptional regulator [Streptomyces sp. NPDC056883]|uniref:LuxR C-terminal-related transcriptional regulator n=1 Tax=Streptomyces sp. NPDC056883 TaxID=3345959 RepID=UPI0036A5B0AC